MPPNRNRRHILVTRPPAVEAYRPPYIPFRLLIPAPPSRQAHGAKLQREFLLAKQEAEQRRTQAGIAVHGAAPGLYIQFESVPDVPLNVAKFEDQRQKIEVVAVSESRAGPDQPRVQLATVFVPDGAVGHFLRRFEQYSKTTPKQKREQRHEDMLDRIAALRLATLRALWTDAPDIYPADGDTIWWEVWLRRHDGQEVARFVEYAGVTRLRLCDRRLEFDDRIVMLARGTPAQLAASIDVLNDIAEVRRAKETAAFFVEQPPGEQAAWVNDLRGRTTPPSEMAPAVCILDTGVNREHPLLAPALASADAQAVDPAWGSHDNGGGPEMEGHGTEMAGLALFGDLTPLLAAVDPVTLVHRLESVKILPPPPQPPNEPDLYGAITAIAISRAEIQAPARRRCFSMAVTARDNRDRGQPTSWSAAIDALAAGRSFDQTRQGLIYLPAAGSHLRRLFVLCAGNVSALEVAHLERSDIEPIHDPAQAWNALTVGAYTELAEVRSTDWAGKRPVAGRGDLSPWSCTSVGFATPWPIKPDVIAEGGNVVHDGAGEIDFPVPDLSLLTTYFRPAEKSVVLTWATSAAGAQVARMCGIIAADYPQFWPETIRGLIVHSAEWTPVMTAHLAGATGKRQRARLLRRYGFGVPSLTRALRSAANALTLIVQGTIHPFKDGRMREMHLHNLPWPTAVLSGLGEAPVKMRITLSYFVEPNPARRGWQKRHRYASHGLRFEVKHPTENLEDFRKRLNQRALEEEEERPATKEDERWFLGEQARNRGSLHSDSWAGMAADLAECGAVGIFPVTGWWKEQKKRDRSEHGVRYSLIISIETPVVEADIWTPVANEVGVPVEVEA